MFIADSTVLSNLQDRLQRSTVVGAQQLQPFWNSIVTAANVQAYWDIINAFMGRGYSKGLVDQWDRGAEFELSIALWWCLEWGLSQDANTYNPEALGKDQLDRRGELHNRMIDGVIRPGILLTIGGLFQAPDQTLGLPTTGAVDTSQDLFSLDPNDTRIGQPTVF